MDLTFKVPYDYTVEVRNSFKGYDLVGRLPEKLKMKFQNKV